MRVFSKKFYTYETQIGKIFISENGKAITHVEFRELSLTDAAMDETPLIRQTYCQISEYLNGKRTSFNIPIELNGTEFQKKVWSVLLSIPYGETRTYGFVAAEIGNNKAYRAVGLANNRNPISIIVPCHRVIGADGSLVGYGGGLDIKKILLEIEAKNSDI